MSTLTSSATSKDTDDDRIYENHIRALRDIYSSESAPRLKECEENNVRGKIRSVHFNRAKQFQKHGMRSEVTQRPTGRLNAKTGLSLSG